MMVDKEKDEAIKDSTINDIIGLLQTYAINISSMGESLVDQLTRMNVALDTMRFLKDYDENVKILQRFVKDPRFNGER